MSSSLKERRDLVDYRCEAIHGCAVDAQATTETVTAGTYVDNNDGTYQYTFANPLTA